MRRMRLGVLAGVGSLVVAFGASTAYACNEPTLAHLSPGQASPGDSVAYSISDMDAGATYTLSIEGRTVASGGADGAGSFVMPDLGTEPRQVTVVAVVTHSGAGGSHENGNSGPWSSSKPLSYVPPSGAGSGGGPATSPEQSGAGSPSEQVQQPESSPGSGQGSAGGEKSRGGSGHTGGSRGDRAGDGAGAGSQVTQPEETRAPAVNTTAATSDGSDAPAEVTASVTALSSEATAEASASRQSATGGSDSTDSSSSASAAAHVSTSDPALVPAAPLPTEHVGELDMPVLVVVSTALLLLLGLGGVLFAAVRERLTPPDGEREARYALFVPYEVERELEFRAVEIEAELQEMIAEVRARELLRGPPRGVGANESPRTDVGQADADRVAAPG